MPPTSAQYNVTILDHHWFKDEIYELRCTRPPGFTFQPGQFVELGHQHLEREYTIVSAPEEAVLRLLIKRMPQGNLSVLLAELPPGTILNLSAAKGYFCFQPSDKQPCFIATGTGIAPFIAMYAAGVRDFTLLHGVRHPSALVYRNELNAAARCYMPCLSAPIPTGTDFPCFQGYVSTYVRTVLPHGDYDFYLCGRRAMIHDLTHLLDERYPQARIYSEAYD